MDIFYHGFPNRQNKADQLTTTALSARYSFFVYGEVLYKAYKRLDAYCLGVA